MACATSSLQARDESEMCSSSLWQFPMRSSHHITCAQGSLWNIHVHQPHHFISYSQHLLTIFLTALIKLSLTPCFFFPYPLWLCQPWTETLHNQPKKKKTWRNSTETSQGWSSGQRKRSETERKTCIQPGYQMGMGALIPTGSSKHCSRCNCRYEILWDGTVATVAVKVCSPWIRWGASK